MGVMCCSRKGCDNIMCDTYVLSVGYVCSDCQSEFKEYVQREDGRIPTTTEEITSELERFMDTPKGSPIDNVEKRIDDFFRDHDIR